MGLEAELASQDSRFAYHLKAAQALYHHGVKGAAFEESVQSIVNDLLPPAFQGRDYLLDGDASARKQLDIVVVSASSVPRLLRSLFITAMTAVGEVKTNLTDGADLVRTAGLLKTAQATARRESTVPFFTLAGKVERSLEWTARQVQAICSTTGPAIWPAIFSFGGQHRSSTIEVGPGRPIRALSKDGHDLSGVASIDSSACSPSVVLYLWLWAAVYSGDAVQGMDFRSLSQTVRALTKGDNGLEVTFYPEDGGEKASIDGVQLVLPEPVFPAATPAPRTRSDADPGASSTNPASTVGLAEPRRVVLITLGIWIDQIDTWDESPWGGSPVASRSGYGWRAGLPDDDLLNGARLFWRWNPTSPTWSGMDLAVVAHGGVTRSVLRIDRFIGPLWGRFGFQGSVVHDPDIVRGLVGRNVPRRQNPITTITL